MTRASSLTDARDDAVPTVTPLDPPRVRIEWVVAATRIVLATGLLLAVLIDPLEHVRSSLLIFLLGCYLAYSGGMLTLVWAPLRVARGWGIAVHLFDFAAFSVLMLVTQTASSFFMGFIFLLVCGTLRWQVRGTIWTAAATMIAYAGVSLHATYVLRVDGFGLNTFVIRSVYLTVITVLLAYLSAHHHRFQTEISRIAAWPRRISREPGEVVAEILSEVGALLKAPRVVLVWEETGQSGLNLASISGGHVAWSQETAAAYDPIVLPALNGRSFHVADAAHDRAKVMVLEQDGLRRRNGRPIHEGLRTRFAMRAVQSWPLNGELIHGRLFCLDTARRGLDDLIVGEIVSDLALSRLEGHYMLKRLREAAALKERVRVARDLHDGLLQSQAGAALQLLAARRLLDRDAAGARERLQEVQEQLEHSELEMRSFIGGLRPQKPARAASLVNLADRFEELRRRVERQWEVSVDLRLTGAVGDIPDTLHDEVYRLAQEALANAGRHAGASTISLTVAIEDDELHLEVVDNGRGFPFHGTYDLASLNGIDKGPLTLKERVARLAGTLTLKSMPTGTAVQMTLPVAHTAGGVCPFDS